MAHREKQYCLSMVLLAVVPIAALLAWRLYWPPALYRATVLPSLGAWRTEACSLNDLGQVTGVAYVGDQNKRRVFLWDRENGMRDLGLTASERPMINNAGQISGTMPVEPNDEQAFLWEPGTGRTVLGTLGGKKSIASGMNNRGQIIGVSPDESHSSPAFLWDKVTGMRRLSGPDGAWCWPRSINDAGQVLVDLLEYSARPTRHFILDPNGPVFLDTVPPDAWPTNINNISFIAGREMLDGGRKACLVLWDEQRRMRRLLPSDVHTTTRLNDKNQIAYTEIRRSRAKELEDRFIRRRFDREEAVSYLWDPTRGRVPLNRYMHRIERFFVADLNNDGRIIGTAETRDGDTCSVLLEPIAERWKK